MNTLIELPLNEILVDNAITPNLWGITGSTVTLQKSIKEFGGLPEPLTVTKVDGKHYITNGFHQLAALRRLKWQKPIPCLVRTQNDGDLLAYMILAAHKKPIPHVVTKDEKVIAGLCWACHMMTDAKSERPSNEMIATIMNIKDPDIIGAYRALFYEPYEIVKRVESGELAITVYSRLKRQPLSLKLQIVRHHLGKISRRFVDRALRGEIDFNEVKEEVDEETKTVDFSQMLEQYEAERPSNSELLSRLEAIVKQVVMCDLTAVDRDRLSVSADKLSTVIF